MGPLLSRLTCGPTSCIIECASEVVLEVGDWDVSLQKVHLHIYGLTKPPHLLQHYVLDKLILLYISYHTYVIAFEETMTRKKKTP